MTWAEIRASLVVIAGHPAVPNLVALRMAPLSGELFWMSTAQDGALFRLDAAGHIAALTTTALLAEATRAAGSAVIASALLLRSADAYYYQRRGPIRLPVLRVIVNDAQRTRLYLDPLSGRVLGLDGNGFA